MIGLLKTDNRTKMAQRYISLLEHTMAVVIMYLGAFFVLKEDLFDFSPEEIL